MNLINKFLTGVLCPKIKHQIQNKVELNRCFLVIILILFVSCQTLAQEVKVQNVPPAAKVTSMDNETEITPLKIGDKIPDELWDMYFPVVSTASENEQYLSLGDFKDKLIILDFWATWCAPCISSLNKLDELQKEFEGELVVVPTSYESKEKVQPFFANKGWSLPTAYEETVLKGYFPHRSVPHQVWIKDGEVLAITGSEYASRENISSIIIGDTVLMMTKEEDIFFDPELIVERDRKNILSQSTFTKRANVRLGGVSTSADGMVVYNSDVLGLIREAYSPSIFPAYFENRILWELRDSIKYKLHFPKEFRATKGDYHVDNMKFDWLANYTFCYILSLPQNVNYDELLNIYRNHLSEFIAVSFKCHIEIDKRAVSSMVLRKIKKVSKPDKVSKSRHPSHEKVVLSSYNSLYRYLNRLFKDSTIPIIRENKNFPDQKFELDRGANTITALNKSLALYGLEIVERIENIDMLIVSEL